jgi:tRNA threonylcarbamoyl adenosine modification protein YeaZ
MSLLLAVETASSRHAVALGWMDEARFDSTRDAGVDPRFRDLGLVVAHGLETAGIRAAELDAIAVDVGPGGLGSVRSGVAFTNALAFSLGVPVCPVSYFQVVGAQAERAVDLPVLIVVPAVAGTAYAGLYRGGAVERLRVLPLAAVGRELCGGVERVAVAGRLRDRIVPHLAGIETVDTGIEKPDPAILLEIGSRAFAEGTTETQAAPLNEQSSIFHEPGIHHRPE